MMYDASMVSTQWAIDVHPSSFNPTATPKAEYQTADVVVYLASGPNPAKLCSMVSTIWVLGSY